MSSSSSDESSSQSPDSLHEESDLKGREGSLTKPHGAKEPGKKIPMTSFAFTGRQKERLIYLPLMILLLALTGVLIAVIEMKCASSLKTAETIRENYTTFYVMRGCYAFILFYLLAAACSSFPVKKPSEVWAITFSVGVLIVWFVSVFVGSHYHSEVARLREKRFNPIRQESFDRILKKTYTASGTFTTTVVAGKNLTVVRPTPSKIFFNNLNQWLDKVQSSMECCGIEGFEDYHSDLVRTFNPNTGVTAITENAKKQIGLREKHVLNQLNAAGEIPDVRQSCCKKQTKDCNFNIFDTIPPKKDNIYTRGCRLVIYEGFLSCRTWFWVAAMLPLIVGIPATILGYKYTRHAQGLTFTACGSARRTRDPDLLEDDDKKFSANDGPSKKGDGKVAPMEGKMETTPNETKPSGKNPAGGVTPSGTAVYRVIEHIPSKNVRRSRDLPAKK